MKLAGSIILVCSSVGLAVAQPKVEVLDRGNAVEVIAHDVKAAATTISSVRSRIEVPVVGSPSITHSANDKSVKIVEMTGSGKKSLSIKLGMERPEVAALAKQAQAIQVGNDLHVIIPRAVAPAGTAVDLPEPTLTPELAAKAAAMAPVTTVSSELNVKIAEAEIKPPAAIEVPKAAELPKADEHAAAATDAHDAKPADAAHADATDEKKTDAAAAKTDAKTETKAEPKAETKKEKIAGAPEPSASRNFPILIALVLAGIGSFAWMKRRKNKPATKEANSIEVVASKSLGGKAKIVWLQAGGREIIVSVTPQAVRMLGSWKKSSESASNASHLMNDAIINLPEARTVSQQIPVVEKKATSPAVSGLLKLRQKTQATDDVIASDDSDADALWAKEILAATTGARR